MDLGIGKAGSASGNSCSVIKYPLAINNMKDYIRAVYVTLIDKASPEAEGKTQYHRTITISTLNQSGRVRKLPNKVVLDLLDSGREGARRFFSERKTGLEPATYSLGSCRSTR